MKDKTPFPKEGMKVTELSEKEKEKLEEKVKPLY
jgi:hypothetical protein